MPQVLYPVAPHRHEEAKLWIPAYSGMTLKEGSGLKRLETEISLTAQQFNALWPLTEGYRLEKRRYALPHHSQEITIDVFDGSLDPLILMEVEFADEKQSEQFTPPAFVDREVTGDACFNNANLAKQGLLVIESQTQ